MRKEDGTMMGKRRLSAESESSSHASKSMLPPELMDSYRSVLFDLYKNFERNEGGYSKIKFRHFACPFYKIQSESYKGLRNTACQGYGADDISALRSVFQYYAHAGEGKKRAN